MLLLLTITFIILYVWQKQKMRNLEKFASQIPGPVGIPIIGTLYEFIGKGMTGCFIIQKKLYQEFKHELLFKIWLGNYLVIVPTDPNATEVLLSKSVNKSELCSVTYVLANGISLVSGPRWKLERRFVSKMFFPHLMESYVQTFNNKSRTMVKKLEDVPCSRSINIQKYVMSCGIDTICCTAMGVDTNTLSKGDFSPHQNLTLALDILIQRMYKPWEWIDFIFFRTKDGRKCHKAVIQFHTFMRSVVNERRRIRLKEKEENKSNKENRNSENGNNQEHTKTYLDLKLDYAEKNNIDDSQLQSELSDVVIGGTDTSGVVTSFALLMLAMHEEWQEKVHRELDEYFGDSDCNVTINDITKLQTLDIVFKESLRLSATPHTLRQLDEDTKVDKYTVPTGTLVYIPVYILHRDSRYWSHPDEFYPEHFLPKNEDKRPRCSYIPFTFGPRNCIGGKYGTTFTKIMLIHILRKFKLSTELKYHELKYKPKVMLEVANGYYIKLHRRK